MSFRARRSASSCGTPEGAPGEGRRVSWTGRTALAGELGLGTLARVAGFSDWHFHRIFASLVGENLHAYVRRRRLTAAAHRLLFDPGRTVTAVALDCGFANASDLSRAFRALYGSSPRQFRRRKGTLPMHPRGDGDREPRVLDQASREAHGERITIQRLPDLHVAYIRSFGLSPERKSPAVERAFRRLHAWAASGGYLSADTRLLGLTRDNPEVQPLERCRYDACITVPLQARGSSDISVGTIPTAGARRP